MFFSIKNNWTSTIIDQQNSIKSLIVINHDSLGNLIFSCCIIRQGITVLELPEIALENTVIPANY